MPVIQDKPILSGGAASGTERAAAGEVPVTPAFNLVDEPWIRCLMVDGTVTELGIRDTFRRSRAIRRLSNEIPTQDYAILRLLTVILGRAAVLDEAQTALESGNPSSWWRRLLGEESLLTSFTDHYLGEFHDRFWLRHPTQPFMQVADLHTQNGGHNDVTRMIVDAENDYFAMRAGSGTASLEFADAARWLVHLQAFDYAGIKSGAVGDPRVKGGRGYPIGTGWCGNTGGVVIHGSSLHETLLLNMPPRLLHSLWEAQGRAALGDQAEDQPAWERPPATAAPRAMEAIAPDGPVDLLTWQARRVRLFFSGDRVDGVLVSNGDRIDPVNRFEDPMTGYRFSRNKSKKGQTVFFAQTHDSAEPLWRGLEPLLTRYGVGTPSTRGEPRAEERPRPPLTVGSLMQTEEQELGLEGLATVQLVGLEYGPQSAVVVNAVNAELDLDLAMLTAGGALLRGLVTDAAARTREAARLISRYARMLVQAQAPGMGWAQAPDQSTQGQRYLAEVEPAFRAWVRTLGPRTDPAAAERAWREEARRVVLRLVDALAEEAGPAAAIGWIEGEQIHSTAHARAWVRRELGSQLPDRRPRARGDGDPLEEQEATVNEERETR